MNREKDLLKQLKKDVVNGNFILDKIMIMINEDKLPQKSSSKLLKIFYGLRKNAYKIIDENFEEIFLKLDNGSRIELMKILMEEPEYSKIVENHFIQIIRNSTSEIFTSQLYDYFLEYNEQYIMDNIKEIIENTPGKYLLETATKLKFIDDEIDEELEKQLEERTNDIALSMIQSAIQKEKTYFYRKDKNYSEQDKEEIAEILSIIIKELLKEQNEQAININVVGRGSSAIVYQIGDKILKVGAPKANYNIPNHKRILQPLIRKNLKTAKGEELINVEVTNNVNTRISNDDKKRIVLREKLKQSGQEYGPIQVEKINDDDVLYLLYKEVRKSGIIITDMDWRNFGVLTGKNIPTLNNKEMLSDENATGLSPAMYKKPLKEGDIVYIDLEHIYKENDKNIIWPVNSKSKQFEKRYQSECGTVGQTQKEQEQKDER